MSVVDYLIDTYEDESERAMLQEEFIRDKIPIL